MNSRNSKWLELQLRPITSVTKYIYFFKVNQQLSHTKAYNKKIGIKISVSKCRHGRQTQENDRTQKPLHPSINSDFTPFHEPKNQRPNISLEKL